MYMWCSLIIFTWNLSYALEHVLFHFFSVPFFKVSDKGSSEKPGNRVSVRT